MQTCRFCGHNLKSKFVDLGMSPISNRLISPDALQQAEPFYPLKALVCESCFLVQLSHSQEPDAFFDENYVYFSSFSDSWLTHAKNFAFEIAENEALSSESKVVEVASNDGYLLRHFRDLGVQVLGVEPTPNTAAAANREHGIESDISFFGLQTAKRLAETGISADVMIANNVLAHVPDINDFVSGFPILLKKGGLATFEFPHLLKLIKGVQFDTIYHEHFSYLSLSFCVELFRSHGMRIFNVKELPTHGGSLRLYVAHMEDKNRIENASVNHVLKLEEQAGLRDVGCYEKFSEAVIDAKCGFLEFLVTARRERKSVAAYGAPAKGNTFLNYCGVGRELIQFTVDRNPSKIGKYLPGSRIPIYAVERIKESKPDYIVVLPWNLRDEIFEQLEFVREWKGKLVTAIPQVEIKL